MEHEDGDEETLDIDEVKVRPRASYPGDPERALLFRYLGIS